MTRRKLAALSVLLTLSATADTDRNALRSPVAVPGLDHVAEAAVGLRFYVVRLHDGQVLTWGDRPGTEVPGRGPEQGGLLPVRVPASVSVAAGSSHALSAGRDGSVWAWGANASGQLGSGRPGAGSTQPVRVPGLDNAVAVAARGDSSYALLADGRILGWGGRLWLSGSRFLAATSPAVVPGISNAVAVRAGLPCLALLRDGSVAAWGEGYLGDGSMYQMEYSAQKVPQPARVAGIDDAVAIAAGASRSGVIRRDGSVWVWGKGDSGALGLGKSQVREPNEGDRATPVRMPGVTKAAELTLASGSSLVFPDGTVRTWGDARLGATGRPGIGRVDTPSVVPGARDVVRVYAFAYSNLALTQDGRLLAWGSVVLPQP